MKTIVALAAIINSVSAAPAILWAGESSTPTTHSSDVTELDTVVRRALSKSSTHEPSLKSAIFVLSRDAHGNDGLTSHSNAGNLPTIGSLYDSAHSIEHHVRGLSSIQAVSRSTQLATGQERSVIETTLDEIHSYSGSMDASATIASDGSTENHRALSSADVAIVHIDSKVDSKDIDAAVSSAIRSKDIGSVILTTYRSESEAQLERNLQRRASKQPPKRRLEDAENKEDENDQDQDSDYAGVYFVNFTPNIFAGLMFGFFFIMVTYTGITSLNNISGQGDIYVTKYPHIGREA